MAWYAVWATANGKLESTGTVITNSGEDVPTATARLAAKGLSVTDFGTPQTGMWNTTTHVFDAAPVLKSVLQPKAFWDRWTPTEREALVNLQQTGTQTQKNKLQAFKDYVRDAGIVDCNDSYIQTMVNLAESAGIIAAGRAAVILA
jgi:hypothetical protein